MAQLQNALKLIKASLADASVSNPQREVIIREILTAYAKADLAIVREDQKANELVYNVSYRPKQTADIEINWDCMAAADDDSNDGNIPDDINFELLNSDDACMKKSAVKLMLNYFKSCTSIYDARDAVGQVLQGLLNMHLEHYKIAGTDAADSAYIEASAFGNKWSIDFDGDVQNTDDDASETADDNVKLATAEPTAPVKSAATDSITTEPTADVLEVAQKNATDNTEVSEKSAADLSTKNYATHMATIKQALEIGDDQSQDMMEELFKSYAIGVRIAMLPVFSEEYWFIASYIPAMDDVQVLIDDGRTLMTYTDSDKDEDASDEDDDDEDDA